MHTPPGLNGKIMMVLGMRPGRPISRQGLCSLLCVSDRRLRAAVTALVIEGAPIVTMGSKGYRIAQCTDDVKHEIGQLRSRAFKIIKRAAALEKISAPKFAGQLAFDLAREAAVA